MGELADEFIARMQGFGHNVRRRTVCRPETTPEERRAFAEARHEEMLDELVDELPGDEEDGDRPD